ncbi:hypothetical protein K402DRAFT_451702 [Aulographum hederae CBS 113979]|uniref:F-box domain-containing protein n=1 Tax=Aulographum hederae CBS 113979 TaxID=1176131 RepID=A0A6G1HAP4_9PEZI|nr:hypothetical protein K402DRAFT_451702 [Aulographum hederae CBS 113979]
MAIKRKRGSTSAVGDQHAPTTTTKRQKSHRHDTGEHFEVFNRERNPQANKKNDHISILSDELILRILENLTAAELTLCERISKKFRGIGQDSELWKRLYYDRFVRPRASRIPRKQGEARTKRVYIYSSQHANWVDDKNLVRSKNTNWKKQYMLRDNWARGSCDVAEIQVSEQPPVPPLLAELHDGVTYTADVVEGIRAWSTKGGDLKLLGATVLSGDRPSPPICLAVDSQTPVGKTPRIVIGFENGGYALFQLEADTGVFKEFYTHTPSSNGTLTALAFAFPYLLTMNANHLMSLYRFSGSEDPVKTTSPPRLLHSLAAHTVRQPLSLSLRLFPENIVAAIAFATPSFLSGWSATVQELRMTLEGSLVDARLSTSPDENFYPVSTMLSTNASPRTGAANSALPPFSSVLSESSTPTSISYNHPYLLVVHPDNTLALHMVRSTSSELFVSPGSRLWGHTSAVSSAHVSSKGKAVSVSKRGGELRIWDLEGGFTSSAAREGFAHRDLSVQVRLDKRGSETVQQVGSGLVYALSQKSEELDVTKNWIGFDDENVIVLREKSQGSQALVVYDFS